MGEPKYIRYTDPEACPHDCLSATTEIMWARQLDPHEPRELLQKRQCLVCGHCEWREVETEPEPAEK